MRVPVAVLARSHDRGSSGWFRMLEEPDRNHPRPTEANAQLVPAPDVAKDLAVGSVPTFGS